MNKARRHELKMLKYRKRLRNYRIKVEPGVKSNLYAFRSHGKPCSCVFCSRGKAILNGDKKLAYKELQFQINESLAVNERQLPKNGLMALLTVLAEDTEDPMHSIFEDILMYA